ncbi:MAG: CvpA family protein [Candidatus Omnitrophica bacterium]|nr:CvpA family protein [Candidatus Omnitrophota bacterium]
MNWVDVMIAILLLRISYATFKEGLSHSIFPLFASAAVLILSLHYYIALGSIISKHIPGIHWMAANFISFLLLVVVLSILSKFLKAIIDIIVQVQWHPAIEKWGGLAIGLLKAAVITATILSILMLAPLPYFQRSIKDKSLTGRAILRIGPVMYCKAAGFLSKVGFVQRTPSEEKVMEELEWYKEIPVKK